MTAASARKIRIHRSLIVSSIVVRQAARLGLKTRGPRVSKGAHAPEAQAVKRRGLAIAISGTTGRAALKRVMTKSAAKRTEFDWTLKLLKLNQTLQKTT